MRRSLALMALAAAACAHTDTAPTVEAPASLAAAESAFAAHSVREDMRAAFIAAFAADGVFVRNTGWEVAPDWLRDRPPPPIVLDWRPQYVEVAAAGDLGLSTGPWKITSRKDPKADPAYGQFVSIWRREGGGPWKVAVDLGIGNPEPSLWPAPLEARQRPAAAASSAGSITDAEARFAQVSRGKDPRAAYEAMGAEDLRFYRDGEPPSASRTRALASPAMAQRWAWTVERSEVSSSNDLGYARGYYTSADQPSRKAGYFMRAWRREAGGWRIVMDVINPAAPA